jgi:hypothetical protein
MNLPQKPRYSLNSHENFCKEIAKILIKFDLSGRFTGSDTHCPSSDKTPVQGAAFQAQDCFGNSLVGPCEIAYKSSL